MASIRDRPLLPGSGPSDGNLPTELLFDILSRLPVKPLVRFKSVSPSWRSLIEDPAFIAKHLMRSAPKDRAAGIHLVRIRGNRGNAFAIASLSGNGAESSKLLPISSKLLPIARPPLPTRFRRHPDPIVGCRNGVVCGLFTQYEADEPSEATTARTYLYLWNPATREYRTLPSQTSFNFAHGFGYDPATDDYKVVKFAARYAMVFSLRDGSWKTVAEPPKDAPIDFPVQSGCVQLNGVLYWMARKTKTDSYGAPDVIVSFDLETNEFGSFDFDVPDGLSKWNLGPWKITAYNGNSLCVFAYSDSIQSTYSWVREVPTRDQEGEWTWLESFRYPCLGWGVNGELYWKNTYLSRLVEVYDRNTRTVVRKLPYGEYGDCMIDFHGYVESLVPVMQGKSLLHVINRIECE